MKKILAILALTFTTVAAQAKNINFVVPVSPGGQYDAATRVLVKYLSKEVRLNDMSFTVVYRAGAGSQIGTNSVMSLPGGATEILINGNNLLGSTIINPLPDNLPLKEHLHVLGYVGDYPLALAVPNNSKFSTLADLVKYCQSNRINYGTSGIGSTSHLYSAAILTHYNCKSTQIPFKGTGPGLIALLGGHIDMFLMQDSTALLQGNKIKILATQKSDLLSSTTVFPEEIKLPLPWAAIFINSNAPSKDIKNLQDAFTRVLNNPNAIKELKQLGWLNIGKELTSDWLDNEIEYHTRISTELKLINAK